MKLLFKWYIREIICQQANILREKNGFKTIVMFLYTTKGTVSLVVHINVHLKT